MTLAPRDTRADAAARKRERREARRDLARRAFVRTQPCCVPSCGAMGADAHHDPPRSCRGWSDEKIVPLCRRHHTERHTLGYRTFCDRYGVDLHERAAHFARLYEPAF